MNTITWSDVEGPALVHDHGGFTVRVVGRSALRADCAACAWFRWVPGTPAKAFPQ